MPAFPSLEPSLNNRNKNWAREKDSEMKSKRQLNIPCRETNIGKWNQRWMSAVYKFIAAFNLLNEKEEEKKFWLEKIYDHFAHSLVVIIGVEIAFKNVFVNSHTNKSSSLLLKWIRWISFSGLKRRCDIKASTTKANGAMKITLRDGKYIITDEWFFSFWL